LRLSSDTTGIDFGLAWRSTIVPEPGSLCVLLGGGAVLLLRRRRA